MDNAALIDMMVKAGFRCTIITLHTELTAKQVTSARKRLNVVSRGGSGPCRWVRAYWAARLA